MPLEGVVIKSTGNSVMVRFPDGSRKNCKVKGQFRIQGIKHTNPVAIGDHVEVEWQAGDSQGSIISISPRNNYIIRKATKLSSQSQIIAANLDHAFLVVTLAQPRTSNGFIDRFLVTAEGYHIPASLIFNKIDLYDQEKTRLLDRYAEIYEKAGYPIYRVSALTGENVSVIRDLLKDKVSLFSGHSGAGKSALITAIEPPLRLKVGDISKTHHKGKHTTTFAEMFELSHGGFIIDTPGIKEFRLISFEKSEIPRCFPEMDRLLPLCGYSNCTHIHEPDCAVKKALVNGEISSLRYNSYLSMLNDR